MYRRLLVLTVAAALALSFAGCTNKKVHNPIANVNSKQPDKVLFDRSMDAMKHNKFDVARMTLQTLINTYPDSEFVARAKLAIGDSWYAEGGTAALQQAEAEYKDFITFFPNMPEAAEAQYKVANIHFNQMEKPDRDFTHAKRAEEEYRNLIMQFPDSALVPKAKERLREVQEVLGEREFEIGRFYYMRESWPAAIARLTSLVDTYPLYSGADEALFMLGDSYEREIAQIRLSRVPEAQKGKLIADFQNKATDAYDRILTRYPVMPRAEDARKRLEGLKRPVPTPTPEAIAQNKAEEASRSHLGMWGRTMLTFHKRPDMTETAKVGEPTLTDPKQTSAPEIVRHAGDILSGKEEKQVTVEKVGTGTPAANEPTPRSDDQAAPASTEPDNGIPALAPITGDQQSAPAATVAEPTSTVAQGQATSEAAPAPAPAQVNDAKGGESDKAAASADSGEKATQDAAKAMSSSKKKKKKGLGKLNPF